MQNARFLPPAPAFVHLFFRGVTQLDRTSDWASRGVPRGAAASRPGQKERQQEQVAGARRVSCACLLPLLLIFGPRSWHRSSKPNLKS
jgi:hypothetical protein